MDVLLKPTPMTSQKTDYFIRVFEALGMPLVSAGLSHAQNNGGDVKASAQIVAELLTKSVQAGIDLGALVQLEQQGDKAESARIALTALGAQMIADFYRGHKKLPETADLQAMTEAMKTVMGLTSSFEASPEAVLRLDSLHAEGQNIDALQSKAQLMKAFAPVVHVIVTRPLAADEADKSARVQTITQAVLDKAKSISDDGGAAREIVTALAQLYADIHRAEANKTTPSYEQALSDFEAQANLLHVMSDSIVNGGAQAAPAPAAAPADVAASVPEVPATAPPPVETPEQPPLPPEVPAADVLPPAAPEQPPVPPPAQSEPSKPAAPSGPMGFFVKKPPVNEELPPPQESVAPEQPPVAEGAPSIPETPAEPVAPPPAQPAIFDQPIQPPAEAPPEQPINPIVPPADMLPPAAPPEAPATPPPVSPPAEAPATPPPSAEETPPAGQSAGNPMAFFAKKKDEDEEGE